MYKRKIPKDIALGAVIASSMFNNIDSFSADLSKDKQEDTIYNGRSKSELHTKSNNKLSKASNSILENFDNPNDLKFNFSNPNWIVENGMLLSEGMTNPNSSTENEFIVNAKSGDKLQINIKTMCSSMDSGYIYLNGNMVYEKSGFFNDFEIVELDLQEGSNTIKFMVTQDGPGAGEASADGIFVDYIELISQEVITITTIVSEENFENINDLKFGFSNSSWTIENGMLKSEVIDFNESTENEFSINAKAGDKLQIHIKTDCTSMDYGYIYLNGAKVYEKTGSVYNYFETVELTLQEGENIINFKYTQDGPGTDEMGVYIDYIKLLRVEELNIEDIEDAVSKAEQSKNPDDIANARDLINKMPDSSEKNAFKARVDAIFANITLTKETVTSNLDIYIKSENMLSMSLDTNTVTFDNYSGTEPIEKLGAVNITINSSLPYNLNAYMPNKITNADGSNMMDLDILNIRESNEIAYQTFENTTDAIVLKDSYAKGNNNTHGIDLKLASNQAHKADIYKTVIKFEATQK